ncbi:hypothetical protein QBC36DRAFT_312267 [Triangularia setosa]|uniref:Uncharacterized protein n=1 Tax=Triangularia setosa TaxID=2587417 RepID=A0AAN7A6J2_9PEZI|nr:hypothetical protein QBC36DRAFT_312267 [Podospora setosa]
MDWPAETDPCLTTDQTDLEFFDYDCNLADENDFCVALAMQASSTTGIGLEILENPKSWDEWLQSPVFHSRHYSKGPMDSVTEVHGFGILLSSPVTRAFESSDPGSDPHYYLPISKEYWKKIIGSFHMHNSLKDAMLANKSYSSFLVYKPKADEAKANKAKVDGAKADKMKADEAKVDETKADEAKADKTKADKTKVDETKVEMFTATMTSRDWDWNCSISSTYFPESRLTLGVIFNCHPDQKDLVSDMLDRSPEVKDHPLLMLGLYCELQRDRADRLAKRIAARTTEVLEAMGYLPGVTKTGDKSPENQRAKIHIQLRLVISECKKAVEEIRVAKLQTKRITDDICEKSKASKQESFRNATARYKCRFDQIQIELDGRMAQCRITAEDLTYAGDRALAEQAREETAVAARQAKTGKVIAFLAMLYLPMTSIATIFAMPVFDFQNYWWDMRFGGPPPDSPNSESNSKTAEPGVEVASGYFTLYLIISFVLTVATLVSYNIYAKDKPANHTDGNGEGNTKPGTSTGSMGGGSDNAQPIPDVSMGGALPTSSQTQAPLAHNGGSLPPTDLDEKRPILETCRSYFSRNGNRNGGEGGGGNGSSDGSRYRGRGQTISLV